ncbi:Uu.00g007720.m01.CDS01 [Anthostomella pinea]|uniref:Uu.00g007720.m01.CDS01 n=1 Tax=Anthostomella pinea TaxID=933095 RepID=A0AAI8VX34_9PEZI|nr:Uu.00g007720.m01.CDS01 [Anthostomella pinea]
MAPTFAEATAVKPQGSHTYTADFHTEWCIGSVPHGGVVTSVLLRVAATHFNNTLAKLNQPHTIALHSEFLRRTQEGPATIQVRDVKLGRMASTIHVTLTQDGREEVAAYITNSNLEKESGVSYATGWSLEPPPPPVDLPRLSAEGSDANWVEFTDLPYPKLRKATNRVHMHLPRNGQVRPNLIDEWMRLESGQKFTNESIGFVADMWPQMIEGLEGRQKVTGTQPWMWFPTLLLNLDIKKALPPGGAEWLFVRVQSKQIRNGRYDYEVVVRDEAGELVALSHHIALVVDGRRNTAKRITGQSKI